MFILKLLIEEKKHTQQLKWINGSERIFKITYRKEFAELKGRQKSPAMSWPSVDRAPSAGNILKKYH